MNTQRFLQLGICSFMIIVPCAVHAAATSNGGLGSGRLLPSAAAAAGLISVIVASRALRAINRGDVSRTKAIVALVLGLVSLVTGVLHAANAAGSFGTGNGLAGAIVAILLALAGVILSVLALLRLQKIQHLGK